MKCDEARQRLPYYMAGALAWPTRQRLQRHLDACPACRLEAEGHIRVIKLVEALPSHEPPPGLWQGVLNRIEAGEELPLPVPERRRLRAFGVPAAVLAAAAAASLLLMRPPVEPVHVTPAGIEAEYVQHSAQLAASDPLADRVALGSLTVAASWDAPHSPQVTFVSMH